MYKDGGVFIRHIRRDTLPRPMATLCITADFWKKRRVFLTGHTGFKGAWLTVWLHDLGAKVFGYSLPPETTPSMFKELRLARLCRHETGDVRDAAPLARAVRLAKPEIVIHMAAQALVRRGYREPLDTFGTNVMGTANLLDACRGVPSVRAIIIVTTDKTYENREWVYPYRESDRLGGRDPYSASKAGAELVTAAYRRSYFDEAGVGVVSVRAGNVIGGGDWSEDRLIPDAARAFGAGRVLRVRSPSAVRPWQHVLDPLAGYLMLAGALTDTRGHTSPAYNFGPPPDAALTVGDVVARFADAWGGRARWKADPPKHAPHEAGLLMLDPSLARRELGWSPRFCTAEALQLTAEWYRRLYSGATGAEMLALTRSQIAEYTSPPIPF